MTMKENFIDVPHSEDIECTNATAKTIKAIDRGSVHRICSGQVVLTLATAIKELVENSLDAGATSIDVRIKDHGSSLIEVSDNGRGVEPIDFAGLTLKHHTSKLQDFNDLIGVKTFGFRGEALSSLCALSELAITTRHSSEDVGTKLIFDNNGHLSNQISVPRQIGTTVSLQNIFYSLPVRHKEFIRNLKREFNKMIQMLYSYCIISRNVRISCLHQVESGKKTLVVSTAGHSSLKDNISSIFGAKQVSSMVEIQHRNASSDHLIEFGINEKSSLEEKEEFGLEGFISTCAHGFGRSAADRQFYFINSRPCDLTKISRVINEVYHHYNRHQFPMVVLNIKMKSADVDVNVTPDKRQILFNREKHLLASLKTTLLSLFESIPCTFELQNRSLNSFNNSLLQTPSPNGRTTPNNKRLSDLTSRFSRSPSEFSAKATSSKRPSENENEPSAKQRKLDTFIYMKSSEKKENESSSETDDFTPIFSPNPTAGEETLNTSQINDTADVVENTEENPIESLSDKIRSFSSPSTSFCNEVPSTEIRSKTDAFLRNLKTNNTSRPTKKILTPDERPNLVEEIALLHQQEIEVIYEDYDKGAMISNRTKSLTVNVSLLSIKRKLEKHKKKSSAELLNRRFRATISPSDNESAEGELKKEIRKDMFSKMNIVGQFNLGFIISQLGSDLFIIDQHASDEKFNFETLQSTCILQNQRLIRPQTLELTVVNESVLLDNIEIFNKNGFDFAISEEASPGRKVSLISMPHSHGWEFKKEDIDELIFMLSDAPDAPATAGVTCRPSRIRAMFASRACRKSVMIGTALSSAQMGKLVRHMGEIEQPWNCPHGRPTMRHLINIDMLTKL